MAAKLNKRFKFTVEKLQVLPAPADGPAVYYDQDVPQLGVRVQPTGKKAFFVLKQVGGRPQRKTLGTVGELKIDAARKHARRLLNELAEWRAEGCAGLPPTAKPEKGFTFADAVAAYAKSLRPEAAQKANWRLHKHLSGIAALPLEQISGVRLEDVHRHIGETRPIAANRAIEMVRAVFRYAMRHRLTEVSDPTVSVEPYPEKTRDRFLQPEELPRFHKALDAEPNQDLREFVELLLLTGVRKSSLYAARFDELSDAFKTWNIPTTKNGKPLIVQLTPKALSIFLERRKRIADTSPWVFPSVTAKSGHVQDFKNQWKRLRKAAGVPGITLHDLRRTCASYQVIAGASLPIVGASLGHKSTSSTEVYARLHGDAVRRSLLAGEAIQKEMMAAAEKQIHKQRRLPAAAATTVLTS